jgi:hypothetical protein
MGRGMTATDVRDALEDYAREWLAGHLDRRTHEIRALLDTCRPDWSPMLRWAVFLELCDAELSGDQPTTFRLLNEFTGVAA